MKLTRSKGERLFGAILWTVTAALVLYFAVRYWRSLVTDGIWPMYVLLVLIQVTAAAIGWYRWFTYDKKNKT